MAKPVDVHQLVAKGPWKGSTISGPFMAKVPLQGTAIPAAEWRKPTQWNKGGEPITLRYEEAAVWVVTHPQGATCRIRVVNNADLEQQREAVARVAQQQAAQRYEEERAAARLADQVQVDWGKAVQEAAQLVAYAIEAEARTLGDRYVGRHGMRYRTYEGAVFTAYKSGNPAFYGKHSGWEFFKRVEEVDFLAMAAQDQADAAREEIERPLREKEEAIRQEIARLEVENAYCRRPSSQNHLTLKEWQAQGSVKGKRRAA